MRVILIGVARYHFYPNRQAADYREVFMERKLGNVYLAVDKRAGFVRQLQYTDKQAVFDSLALRQSEVHEGLVVLRISPTIFSQIRITTSDNPANGNSNIKPRVIQAILRI